MQIVIGTFIVKPEERDAFIESRREAMRRSRAEAGCITYAFTHDPIEHDVVILTERWADRDSLSAHAKGLKTAPPATGPQPISREVFMYETTNDGRAL